MFPLLIAGDYRHIYASLLGTRSFSSTIGEGMTMDSFVWQICRKAGSNYLHVYFDLYNWFQFSFKLIGKMDGHWVISWWIWGCFIFGCLK